MTIAFERSLLSAVRNRPHVLDNPDEMCSVIFATPENHPQLWREYLLGARDAYRRHGCDSALDLAGVLHGSETTIFAAVVDSDGTVVGGLRVQGPLGDAQESHALSEEWAPGEGREALRDVIDARIDDGVIEVKTAWSDDRFAGARAVAGQMSRSSVILLDICGARHLMATAADHVLRLWESGGGRVCEAVPMTPYPDDRYRTRLMLWDRSWIAVDANPGTWRIMQREMASLRPLESNDELVA